MVRTIARVGFAVGILTLAQVAFTGEANASPSPTTVAAGIRAQANSNLHGSAAPLPTHVPTSGCARQWPNGPYLVETCGSCGVLDLGNKANRDLLLDRAAGDLFNKWIDVGPTWIAGDTNGTLDGALACKNRLGGTVELN